MSLKLSDADLRRNFEMYDKDRSGQISIPELKEIYKTFGLTVKDETIQAMMKKYDRDNSGTIGYDEFVEILTGKKPEQPYGGQAQYGNNAGAQGQ